jgi:isoleucyl-tRNA synthetase
MTKTSHSYPAVDANPNFAAIEEAQLKFWSEHCVFRQSIENRPTTNPDGSSNQYVFYDGPPFANGLPHYGHLLTGYVKDAIARYHTMLGRRVERRFGWDCHGLPAEMGAEKELNISGRAAIMGFGIDKFNAQCRTSVMKYTQYWEYYVTRQGRWVDFKNDYKTMDTPYMESVVWAFSELYKKGLIYESMRVMPYSWAAETPVSNFETRIDNATREREDKAAYVAFKLKNAPANLESLMAKLDYVEHYYLIAWTTTPWTLPCNLALAINKEMEYGYVKLGNACYIAAKKNFEVDPAKTIAAQVENQFKSASNTTETVTFNANFLKGADLLNLTYEPLFPYFANTANAFRVLDGSAFVTDGDGTGIVHMAPGHGEVDQQCCAENGIEVIVPVDEKGRYTDAIYDLPDLQLKGLNVIADKRLEEGDKAQHIAEKDVEKYGLANMRIVRWLKAHGALVKDEPVKHNYPHCWRTDTPLIYRAMSSWYVNVQAIKANMAANNQTIHWIPDHVQSGQMGKGIESAPDWSISRNRFWGTPIPIWKSASGKIIVPGSITEIEKLSGQEVADLHRPFIDNVVITKDGEEYHRIEDVFDCWFESGSMPYAQLHYPFENKKRFEESFPADFITEYIAQTRGWFYTLQVLSAALFGKAPFKNVICHGVVIDEETGLKYSKRLKNYKDPKEVMDAYGADALRWMMLASPVMRGADLAVDPEGKFIRDVVRLNIKPIWSAYNFFTLYANADGVQAKSIQASENLLDRYILAKCKGAVEQVRSSLDAYDTPGATEAITGFFEGLNNWYIRRSRARFWGSEVTPDKQAAYDTLFTVLNLMCIAAAPLLPFTAEAVYRGLNGSTGNAAGSYSPLAGESKSPRSALPSAEIVKKGISVGGANLTSYAREMRKEPTPWEQKLWNLLKSNRLQGLKFRRQEPIDHYIVDFINYENRLIVELDGSQHMDSEYDKTRDAYLQAQGFTVLRFWNNELDKNPDGVLTRVLEAVQHPPTNIVKDDVDSPERGEWEPAAISVHLQDFPDVGGIDAAPELIVDMDRVRDICNTALALRNKNNVRVRQPLQKIEIVVEDMQIAHKWHKLYGREIARIIEEEINVKEVGEGDMYLKDYATKTIQINSAVLGKRLPEKMKQILPASKKGEWKQVDGKVEIAGEKLLSSEYTILLEPKPAYKDSSAPLSTNDALVILDLTITPELEAEGRARDLVRMIQQARKDGGFDVADRVALALELPEDFKAALAEHRAYIAEQTLAVSISDAGAGAAAKQVPQELDGAQFVIGITKAAA